jgi:uncharacterized protein YuzE
MDRISAHYDYEADALMIALEQSYRVDRTTSVSDNINVDWQDDRVVGIEVLNPTRPLRIAAIAASLGFADRLDHIYSAAAMAMGAQIGGAGRLTTMEAWVPVASITTQTGEAT